MTRLDWLAAAADDGLISRDKALDLLQVEGDLTRDEAEYVLTHHDDPPQRLIWSMP